jgi:hypothetical protein
MAYTHTANGLASLGRKGDDTLMHVSKKELAGLQSLLGPITNNPDTGLPEAFNWKDILVSLGVGMLGAYTGGAGAAALGGGALTGTAIGAGTGALAQGAISSAQGRGFGAGALGGAISGGMGGYGGTDMAGGAKPVTSVESLPSNIAGPPEQIVTKPLVSEALKQQAPAMTSKAGLESLLKPVGMGGFMGAEAQNMVEENQAIATQVRKQKLQDQANARDQQQYFADLGYPLAPLETLNSPDNATQRDYYTNLINRQGLAAGGPVIAQGDFNGVPVRTTMPPQYVSDFEKVDTEIEAPKAIEGFKGVVAGALTNGMANGGYVNTQPVNPNAFYPESQIHNANPYPAATPQRHEVIQGFENGGLLDGPGDGMSDDIEANIDGEEEIRLADGEFVVPPDLVRMLGYGDPEEGAKLLDNLLPLVRQAAHGKKEQVNQDAGKLAVEKMMVRAAKGKA